MGMILLVDDNPNFCRVWRDLCEAAGHEVAEAYGGQQALEMLESSPGVDLVITDYHMRPMTGYEMIQRLRTHSETRALPIIMLTGTDKMIHDLVAHEGVTVFNKVAQTGDIMRTIARLVPPPASAATAPAPAAEAPAAAPEPYRIIHTRYDGFVPRDHVIEPR